MRFGEGVGRQVISTKDARVLGTVRRFMVEASAGRVVAIQIQGRAGADLIDWQHVSNFGADAVMVSAAELLRGPASPWEERYVRGEFDLRGNLVLTDDGEAIGRLADVEFDESDGGCGHSSSIRESVRSIDSSPSAHTRSSSLPDACGHRLPDAMRHSGQGMWHIGQGKTRSDRPTR